MTGNLISDLRKNFEKYFQSIVLENCPSQILGLRYSVAYHFGWDGSASVSGKRLRPLFLILTYAALGGKPEDAFQAASALEIFHNFTLIHDDIQDHGETRHGHPALWTKVGVPLAINIGDYLAALSQHLMGNLPFIFPFADQKKALDEFQDAALAVIRGNNLTSSMKRLIRSGRRISCHDPPEDRPLFSASFSIAAN
jgi:geranylgeranyl pyrophosphate synthase